MHADNAAGRIAATTEIQAADQIRWIYARPFFYEYPLQLLLSEVPHPNVYAERLHWQEENDIRQAGGDPFIPVVAAAYPGYKVIAADYADRDEAVTYVITAEE